MPNKPRWLLRLPEIIEHLATISDPTVDRGVIELLFQLRRRRAIELMHQLGSYRAGGAFVLDRIALLTKLRAMHDSPEFRWEQYRQIADVAIALNNELTGLPPLDRCIDDLRASNLAVRICLQPGRLEIHFQRSEDLLRCLTELARAIEEHGEEILKSGSQAGR